MELLRDYKIAAESSGRSVFELIIEAARLRFSQNRLGLTEYIDFRLFENNLSWKDKCGFGGYRLADAAEELLVDDYSRFLSIDKISMYALLNETGFPIPKLRATYRTLRPAKYRQLQTEDELIAYLKEPGNPPIYIKRAFGSYGRGNCLIQLCDGETITFGNGKTEAVKSFAKSLDSGGSLGWILQDPLSPHANIADLTGSNKISGVRIHTFLGTHRPKILKAILKINSGKIDSDNFDHGASGNMLAAVDIDTGRIIRAISGVGHNQRELSVNPKSGRSLVGFKVPHWKDVVDLVLDAQKAFPGYLCPGWDIAICPEGPVILEVNASGDIDLAQHAYRKPFFDEEFMCCLTERGLETLLYRSSGKNIRSARNGRVGSRKFHWPW